MERGGQVRGGQVRGGQVRGRQVRGGQMRGGNLVVSSGFSCVRRNMWYVTTNQN